jgi:predicted metalloendopeptidase
LKTLKQFKGLRFLISEILNDFDFPNIHYFFPFTGEFENWWEPLTEKNFREKAQCIIDLYGNFTDSQVGLTLNGSAIQGENIADIGGLKAAYKGYCESKLNVNKVIINQNQN